MIEVNLLPVELRPVDKTPLPRLLAILGGVALAGVQIVLLLVFFTRLIPNEKDKIRRLKHVVQEVQQDVEDVDKIEQEIQRIEKHKQAIQELMSKRFVWWELFDRLCDPRVIPERVWLGRLEFEPPEQMQRGPSDGQKVPAGKLILECFARAEPNEKSDEAARAQMLGAMAEFMRNLHADVPKEAGVKGLREIFAGPPTPLEGAIELVRAPKQEEGDRVITGLPDTVLRFKLEIPFRAIAAAEGPRN